MKKLSLRQKYMGADWNFVADTEIPKTSKFNGMELEEIEEKFQNFGSHCFDIDKPRKQLVQSQSKPKEFEKISRLRYQSPWYIAPKHWEKLAKLPEIQKKQAEHRAKNLYYFLHKSEPSLNPLKTLKSPIQEHEKQYMETQKNLMSLPALSNYKKHLEKKKLRVPAWIGVILDKNSL